MRGWAEALRPVAALVVRDLRAARRSAGLRAARAVLIAASASLALLGLWSFRPGGAHVGRLGWSVVVAAGVASLLLTPALAVQALRGERERGTLDVLLLAGLTPRALALGRAVGAFLLLQGLLLDVLPALAAFSFVRDPAPGELVLAALALSGLNALLAGLAVALSATFERAGPCACVAILGVALLALAEGAGALSALPSPGGVLAALASDRPVGPEEAARALAVLLLGLAAGLGLALAAGRQLDLAGRTRRLPPVGAAGRRVSRRFPLTWLALRSSPAARPAVQLALVPLPIVAVVASMAAGGLLRGRSPRLDELAATPVVVAGGVILAAVTLLVGIFAGATQVSGARDRDEWDAVLATGRPGRSLLRDLWAAAAVPAIVPALLSAGLLGLGLEGLVGRALAALALLGIAAFAAVIGVLSALVTQSLGGALVLALETVLVVGGLLFGARVLGEGLAPLAPVTWLVAAAAGAVLLRGERASRHARLVALAALPPAACAPALAAEGVAAPGGWALLALLLVVTPAAVAAAVHGRADRWLGRAAA